VKFVDGFQQLVRAEPALDFKHRNCIVDTPEAQQLSMVGNGRPAKGCFAHDEIPSEAN
jgi:hypothetical protein